MAGGGTFIPGVPKVRPGIYANFKSANAPVTIAEREGITVVPFFGHSWGPCKQYIEINKDNIATIAEQLGYAVSDSNENMILVREALKGCSRVKVYIVGSGGTKATATNNKLTVTAKYPGTRGNDVRFVISANVVSGWDLSIMLDEVVTYRYESLTKIADVLALDCPIVDFFAAAEDVDTALAATAVAGIKLTGGVNASITNNDFTKWLDSLDNTAFKAVCLPVNKTAEDFASKATAFVSKIKYLRDGMGKTVRGAMPQYAANYIGIDSVRNAPIVDGTSLTLAQASAFVAGLAAGSDDLTSNTNRVYPGATGFDETNLLSHEEIEAAILAGEFVFSLSEDEEVVVEYDINSLTTPSEDQDESYKKNRTIRTFDAVIDRIKADIRIATIDSTDEGFDMIDGLGASDLAYFQKRGSLKNVEEGDFLIDRAASKGDAAYVSIGLQAVDSIEKMYFYVLTN